MVMPLPSKQESRVRFPPPAPFVRLDFVKFDQTDPAAMSAQIAAARAMEATGCAPHRMMSGAGHDAMILAEKIPAAMIFLRSPAGISHDPAESVAVEDVEKAIECGLHLLDQLASSSILHERMCRA